MSPLETDLAAMAALSRRDPSRASSEIEVRSSARWAARRYGCCSSPAGFTIRSVEASTAGSATASFAYAGAIAKDALLFWRDVPRASPSCGTASSECCGRFSSLPCRERRSFSARRWRGRAWTFVQGLVAACFAPLVGVHLAGFDVVRLPPRDDAGVMAVAITALGVTVGSRMRTSSRSFGVISNFVVLPLYFLSGGVFPPEGLPAWMRALVLANPVTYGAGPHAGHDRPRQPHTFPALLDAAVQGAFALAMCTGFALVAFRRAARLVDLRETVACAIRHTLRNATVFRSQPAVLFGLSA